jgi:hypothetical protein
MEDLTGKRLGPYTVVEPLGEGGMAAVYKAYQPAMDRFVALKILPRQYADDPDFVARFSQEARVIAKLEHQNILPVFDFGEAEGYAYIGMRFVETGTLADYLQGEPLSLEQVCRIITQVGGALDYAHARGVVHRDLKPSNVLIDHSGNCLLTDFGLAKMVEGSAQLTATGCVLGTPAYMSPEQGLGKPAEARSDIYALGVVLYEMTTGRLPYHAETPVAIILKHIQGPLPPPRTRNPGLPESVERVILKSLAKEPADRYSTAGEMVHALRAAIPSATSVDALAPLLRRKPAVRPRWTAPSPARAREPDFKVPLKEDVASIQLRRYWKHLRAKNGAYALYAVSGFFAANGVFIAIISAFGLLGMAVEPGTSRWLNVIFILSVYLLLAAPFFWLGRRKLRRSRVLLKELEETAAKEGNYYICPCGVPKRKYSRLQVYVCFLLFPYGLISLFYPLKKCKTCGRPYRSWSAPFAHAEV